jgi:hypothetical protein
VRLAVDQLVSIDRYRRIHTELTQSNYDKPYGGGDPEYWLRFERPIDSLLGAAIRRLNVALKDLQYYVKASPFKATAKPEIIDGEIVAASSDSVRVGAARAVRVGPPPLPAAAPRADSQESLPPPPPPLPPPPPPTAISLPQAPVQRLAK